MTAVLLLLGVGVLAGRARVLPEGAVGTIDQLIIRLALPGVIVARISQLDLGLDAIAPVAVAWGGVAVISGLVLIASRVAGWDRTTTGTLLLVVPLGNTSFLGIPAVEALLGTDHVPYAVIYDQLGSFLALATFGTIVAARFGDGAQPTAAGTLRRILVFPPFVALVASLAMRLVAVPTVLLDVATMLGAMLTPLAMLSVGMRLALPRAATVGPLATGLTLRLLVAPGIVWIIGSAFAMGLGDSAADIAWRTANLEAAMPPMVTASVIAIASGLDERLASALVGVGVLASVLTLPAWAAILS